VDAYWKEVNHYILVVEKDLFSDTFITAHTVNAIDNCMGYTIWITSKTHFADVRQHATAQRSFNCLINMYVVRCLVLLCLPDFEAVYSPQANRRAAGVVTTTCGH
jgi:hypothetical protein